MIRALLLPALLAAALLASGLLAPGAARAEWQFRGPPLEAVAPEPEPEPDKDEAPESDWVEEEPSEEERAAARVPLHELYPFPWEAWVRSEGGHAVLAIGCNADATYYARLVYLGHDNRGLALRVDYRVDRNPTIRGEWQPSTEAGPLALFTTIRPYLAEFVRQVIPGQRLALDVELLPTLYFTLRGSAATLGHLYAVCPGNPP